MRTVACWVVGVGIALASGCSATDAPEQSTSVTSSSATGACGQECSGKEVTDTDCDRGAFDAIQPQQVRVGNAFGELSLRKSSPARCDHIYWARFVPDGENSVAFEVALVVDGVEAPRQPSEPANPKIAAWTVGVYAKPGVPVQACLLSGDDRKCLDTTSV